MQSRLTRAGHISGQAFNKALAEEASRTGASADRISAALSARIAPSGRTAARGFGSAFGSELTSALPGVSRFTSAMAGYESAAGKVGALAGRAMGLAFTTAAAGLIGAAGYTLFKGFQRYEAIDAANNRLQNLNATLAKTGRATIDVGRVMETVNQVVEGTPFALDKAFGIATTALSGSTGDLKRFMTAVADTAGFLQQPIDSVGQAFLNVAAKGKISMEELSNQLQGLPLDWLAKTVGVSTSELSKMMEEGKVGLEDLLKTVEANISGFAKGSVNTVSGALEQVQTAVARLGANFLSAIFGAPTDDANGLVEALNTIQARLDDVNAWVTAHKDDIAETFRQAADAVHDLWSVLQTIKGVLDDLGIGVDDVVKAFVAWKAIQGVTALTSQLGGINTMLKTTLPASAATGAAGISAALARIVLPAWLATMGLNKIDEATGTNVATTLGEVPFSGTWFFDRIFGDKPWLPNFGSPGAPAPRGPDALGTDFFLGDQPQQAAVPGRGLHWEDGKGWVPDAQLPPGVVAPGAPAGSPIQPPPGLSGDDSSGSKRKQLPVVPYSGDPMSLLQGFSPTSSLFSAAESVLRAQHDRAQAESDLNALMADNEATAEDIQKARNDLVVAEGNIQQTELRLREAKQSELEKYNKQLAGAVTDLGQLGASLDSDFGISKGLSGIAENLTKFLANLAAAPLLGQLGAVKAMSGDLPGGSGLVGIAAAQGMFGPQYTAAYQQMLQGGSYYPSMMGPAALGGGMYPSGFDAALLSQVPAGSYDASGDLSQGLGDCTSAVEDLVNIMDGRPTAGRSMSTDNAAEWLTAHGFLPGSMPGAFNVGFNAGHMQATLPGGTNFNWGSDAAAAAGGRDGGAGAFDPSFTSHYYRPVGGPIGPVARAPSRAARPAVTTSTSTTDPMSDINWAIPPGVDPQHPYGLLPSTASTPARPPTVGPPLSILPGAGSGRWERFTYDDGGILPPGTTIAQNNTGQPEMVTPAGLGQTATATLATAHGGGGSPGPGNYGGVVSPSIPGGSAASGMGVAGDAIATALSAFPGAGAAASAAMQLIGRATKYGGQVAGIGVQGLMDTFLPFGGSELASSNWLTRIGGAFAGMAPQLPNIAGKATEAARQPVPMGAPPMMPSPQQAPTSNTGVHIENYNVVSTEDRAGQDIARWNMPGAR